MKDTSFASVLVKTTAAHAVTNFLTRHSLSAGLVLMFLYTWTIELSHAGVLPMQVPFPLYLTLGWGFIFAALLMTGVTLGRDAAVALSKRFLIWRVGWRWFLAATLIEPACILAGVYAHAALTQTSPDFSTAMAYQLFGASASLPRFFLPFFLVDLINNGEEMGWRGYVLPRLQAKHRALTASLILGVIWGCWHLPKYIGHFSATTFVWSLLHFVAFAVLLTWLYNNTRGSLLVVAICHALSNTVGIFVPMANTVSSAGMGPYICYVLFEVAAAVAITLAAGPAHFAHQAERQVCQPPSRHLAQRAERPILLRCGSENHIIPAQCERPESTVY